jgi:hypothetical protein
MSHPFSRDYMWTHQPFAISGSLESSEQATLTMLSSEAAVQQQKALDAQFFANIAAQLKDADEAWLMSMVGNWPGYRPSRTGPSTVDDLRLLQRIAA